MGTVRALRDSESGRERASSPPIPSNADLVRRALDGQEWAHEVLFRRHARMVAGLSYRLLAGTGVDVDDLIQDSFVLAFSRLGSLRDPDAFSTWLGSIVVRTASKRLRRHRLLLRFGLARSEEVDLDLAISTEAPADVVAELRQTYEVLHELRADERVVFLLRRVEGLTVGEIAARMEVSDSTVKRRLTAAEGRFERAVARRTSRKGSQWEDVSTSTSSVGEANGALPSREHEKRRSP